MDGVWPICEGHQTQTQWRILIKTPVHHPTAREMQATWADWLTHSRYLPENNLGWGWRRKEEIIITHTIPSGWKGLERAENGQVVAGGNRSAGDAEYRDKMGKVPFPSHSSSWSSQWWLPHRSVLRCALLPFCTSLLRNLPWKVLLSNPGRLEVPENESWCQRFPTKATFKLEPRRTEVFKHPSVRELPHSLQRGLSSLQKAGLTRRIAAR